MRGLETNVLLCGAGRIGEESLADRGGWGAESVEQGEISLRVLVEDAGVDGGSEEVVGGRDGVDVTCEVQIHVAHGHDLRVAAPGSAALNPERWPLGRLAYTCHHLLAAVRPQRLAKPDGRGGLSCT